MDDLLFDTVSDEAIQMLMEDAINGTLTDEQNKSIDEYLNGSYDFWKWPKLHSRTPKHKFLMRYRVWRMLEKSVTP